MKLSIKLTSNEIVESVSAFGIISLLIPTLNVAARFTKYDKTKTPQMFNDSVCSFRTDEFSEPFHKLLTENKIEESDVVSTAFELLFGFEYGSIDRIRCGDLKVTMKDGSVVDINEIEDKLMSHQDYASEIMSGELEIELGTICD
jgi:hypothetical protein